MSEELRIKIARLRELLAKAKLPWNAEHKFWVYEGGYGAASRVSPVVRAGLDDFDADNKTSLIALAINTLPELLALIDHLEADGMVLVPRKPTKAMVEAGKVAGFWDGDQSWAGNVWSAMLSALPVLGVGSKSE